MRPLSPALSPQGSGDYGVFVSLRFGRRIVMASSTNGEVRRRRNLLSPLGRGHRRGGGACGGVKRKRLYGGVGGFVGNVPAACPPLPALSPQGRGDYGF